MVTTGRSGMQPLGTTTDVAAAHGLTVAQVRMLVKCGKLPVCFRAGNRMRFDMELLASWQPPAPEPPRRRMRRDKNGHWLLSDERIGRMSTRGWCYMIQSEHGGPVKIGKADDVGERLRGLQMSTPYRLVVRAKFRGGGQTEARLHRQFRKWRLHGEWFNDEAKDLRVLLERGV